MRTKGTPKTTRAKSMSNVDTMLGETTGLLLPDRGNSTMVLILPVEPATAWVIRICNHRSVSRSVVQTLVTSFVLSGLDYGNVTLASIPQHLLRLPQSQINAAAQLLYSSLVDDSKWSVMSTVIFKFPSFFSPAKTWELRCSCIYCILVLYIVFTEISRDVKKVCSKRDSSFFFFCGDRHHQQRYTWYNWISNIYHCVVTAYIWPEAAGPTCKIYPTHPPKYTPSPFKQAQ